MLVQISNLWRVFDDPDEAWDYYFRHPECGVPEFGEVDNG
jgi:hypothetical protein